MVRSPRHPPLWTVILGPTFLQNPAQKRAEFLRIFGACGATSREGGGGDSEPLPKSLRPWDTLPQAVATPHPLTMTAPNSPQLRQKIFSFFGWFFPAGLAGRLRTVGRGGGGSVARGVPLIAQ